MPPLRARHDPQVIQAWSERMRKYRLQRRRSAGSFLTLAALAAAFAWALDAASAPAGFVLVAAALAALGFVVAIVALSSDADAPNCPQCERLPLDWARRPTVDSLDFCPHCGYWLRSPYRSSDLSAGSERRP